MKRGVIWETIADVFVAGIILFFGLSLFYMFSGIQEQEVDDYFIDQIGDVDNDEIFITYLRSDFSGQNLGDKIAQVHINKEIGFFDNFVLNDEEKALRSDIDQFFEKVYHTKVCWVLYKDEDKWLKENSCKRKEDLLDSTILMPLPDTEKIELRLWIGGYAE